MIATPKFTSVRSTPRKREGVGFAVLLALAWFQVAFASHQFEHVTGDLFDICTVCKHFERQDNAVAQNAADVSPPALFSAPVAIAASHIPASRYHNFHPRAPPTA